MLRFIERNSYSVNYSLSLNNLFIQIFPQSYSVEIGIRIVVDGYDGCLRANEFTDLLKRLNRCMARRMVVVVSLASFQAWCRACDQGLNKGVSFLIISAPAFFHIATIHGIDEGSFFFITELKDIIYPFCKLIAATNKHRKATVLHLSYKPFVFRRVIIIDIGFPLVKLVMRPKSHYGIPDSMDVVSIWGGKTGLSKEQKADMKEVQTKKGTKVLWCQHVVDIGREITPAGHTALEYWGWNGSSYDGSAEADEAIRKYARAIVDTVKHYGYDGCDFDYEPNFGYRGNISGSPAAMHVFLSEIANYMGPTSGSDLILAVDGEPQTLLAETGPLLDYYIIQAYYCPGDYNLDQRFSGLLAKFGVLEDEETIMRKTVWCEDFEKYQTSGGCDFITRDGIHTWSLMGMAMYYRPSLPGCRTGGVGAYRFNLGRSKSDYYHLRAAIQQMNPARK